MKKQSRKSDFVCSYDGNEKADPIHAWMDYEIFINELREKLFPFVRERIEELRGTLDRNEVKFKNRMPSYGKKLDEVQAAYNKRLNEQKAAYSKKLDELQAVYNKVKAAYAIYINEVLPRDVEKQKKRAVRPYLGGVIGGAIGFAILVFIFLNGLFQKYFYH